MIREQLIGRGIEDQRVLDAMRAVPRELFFPPDSRHEAYDDRAAPIGHGQTISQPYIVALMTERLEVEPAHRVLEVGTGSGYHTAVLARLAAEVYTIERIAPLLDEACRRLTALGVDNVRFKHGDGTTGWPEFAPFNRIIITAGAPRIPRLLLLEQLCDGGIAVLPVGPIDEQVLVRVRRRGGELMSEEFCPCRFVKLIGEYGWQQ